jgi:CBS domain containing-hemolysin-like protein
MVPRPDMFAIEAKTTVAAAVEQATERGLSRIPVFEGTVDSIVGLAYLKDLFSEILKGSGAKLVRDMVRPAVIVPEQKKVPDLFREMQGEKFHMAIVVDEHGGVSGLVTLEDLLEEIVGEIVDE